MTALLLAYINAALLLQLGVGIGVWMWRRRRASTPAAAADTRRGSRRRAWPGWRKFRVARREFEDSAQTQCSFYLEPVDGAPLPPFKPGQFLTFSLPVDGAGGPRTITRCYSLSSGRSRRSYRITIKRVPAPRDRSDRRPAPRRATSTTACTRATSST